MSSQTANVRPLQASVSVTNTVPRVVPEYYLPNDSATSVIPLATPMFIPQRSDSHMASQTLQSFPFLPGVIYQHTMVPPIVFQHETSASTYTSLPCHVTISRSTSRARVRLHSIVTHTVLKCMIYFRLKQVDYRRQCRAMKYSTEHHERQEPKQIRTSENQPVRQAERRILPSTSRECRHEGHPRDSSSPEKMVSSSFCFDEYLSYSTHRELNILTCFP